MTERGRITRRDLLMASAALTTAGAVAPAMAAARERQIAGLPSAFSPGERTLRWNRVRERMRRAGFECLLTPAAEGEGDADSRYLTQRSGWVVFPQEGRVILIGDSGDRGRGEEGQWAEEIRPVEDGAWSPVLVQALRDLKMERARIGVGRLRDVLRDLEGDVNYTTLDRVRQALPNARFETAADLLLRVKLVHSAEEIAVLEQATAAGERGLEALFHAATPGRLHSDVWLETFAALTAATGETPSRLALRAGDEANTSGGRPIREALRAGQVFNQEIGARVLGYMAQVNHSFVVGAPAPPDWDGAAQYCLDLFDELVAWIRPGRSYMDLCRLYAQRARSRSPELEPRWVLLHTAGLGDGPRMGLMRKETPDLVMEPTMVFTVKPRVLVKGTRPTVQFGDPILVTETGARRLGKRKLRLLST